MSEVVKLFEHYMEQVVLILAELKSCSTVDLGPIYARIGKAIMGNDCEALLTVLDDLVVLLVQLCPNSDLAKATKPGGVVLTGKPNGTAVGLFLAAATEKLVRWLSSRFSG